MPDVFENDVNMYGTQTIPVCCCSVRPFENDVNMYGTQTRQATGTPRLAFENDVNMYGTQTIVNMAGIITRLRMM